MLAFQQLEKDKKVKLERNSTYDHLRRAIGTLDHHGLLRKELLLLRLWLLALTPPEAGFAWYFRPVSDE